MPRVKFSTLISAMAGKSNGSVFSKNRGGYYFRNNKTGFKLKTSKQQLQQGRFKAVARQWSQLNDFQRQSWNEAVTNYPTKDIFGDDKTRTGYDLFCQLNGALQLRNQPLLISPLVPSPIPSVANCIWSTNDLELYQPVFGVANPLLFNANNLTELSLDYHLNPVVFTDEFFHTFSFQLPIGFNISTTSSFSFNSQFVIGDFDSVLHFKIVRLNTGSVDLSINISFGSFSENVVFSVPLPLFNQFNKVTIQRVPALSEKYSVSFNDISLLASSSSTIGTFVNFSSEKVFINFSQDIIPYSLTLFDFRVYSTSPSVMNLGLVNKGYVLGDEDMIMQCPRFIGDDVSFFGPVYSLGTAVYLVDGIPVAPNIITAPLSLTRVPALQLFTDFSADSSWQFELLCSPPTSEGRSVSSLNYSPISLTISDFAIANDITADVQRVYPYWTGGNDFQMMYRFFNSSTGQVTTPQQVGKPKKGGKRFKAGSELSGKVN